MRDLYIDLPYNLKSSKVPLTPVPANNVDPLLHRAAVIAVLRKDPSLYLHGEPLSLVFRKSNVAPSEELNAALSVIASRIMQLLNLEEVVVSSVQMYLENGASPNEAVLMLTVTRNTGETATAAITQ